MPTPNNNAHHLLGRTSNKYRPGAEGCEVLTCHAYGLLPSEAAEMFLENFSGTPSAMKVRDSFLAFLRGEEFTPVSFYDMKSSGFPFSNNILSFVPRPDRVNAVDAELADHLFNPPMWYAGKVYPPAEPRGGVLFPNVRMWRKYVLDNRSLVPLLFPVVQDGDFLRWPTEEIASLVGELCGSGDIFVINQAHYDDAFFALCSIAGVDVAVEFFSSRVHAIGVRKDQNISPRVSSYLENILGYSPLFCGSPLYSVGDGSEEEFCNAKETNQRLVFQHFHGGVEKGTLSQARKHVTPGGAHSLRAGLYLFTGELPNDVKDPGKLAGGSKRSRRIFCEQIGAAIQLGVKYGDDEVFRRAWDLLKGMDVGLFEAPHLLPKQRVSEGEEAVLTGVLSSGSFTFQEFMELGGESLFPEIASRL